LSFFGITITQTSYQSIYSKSKPIYFITNVSTIFLGINFIRLAAHFVFFFQSLQYTVCNMQIFYFMNSAKFLSSTLLFTPQRHSCSLVLQKPQPLAQNLSGPHPRHLSLWTDKQTGSDLIPYCSLNSADYKFISYFVYGILVHRSIPLQECTQLYCSECTPEQRKPCKQNNTNIFVESVYHQWITFLPVHSTVEIWSTLMTFGQQR